MRLPMDQEQQYRSAADASKIFSWKRIWAVLGQHSAQLGAVAALLVIGGGIWGTMVWLFAEPDVAVEIASTEMRLPSPLSRDLASSLRDVDPNEAESLRIALAELVRFLEVTDHFTIVSVVNNTSKSIENVDIRIRNVRTLTGWAVSGDAFTILERQDILERVRYDKSSNIISVSGIPRIPPQTTLELQIWADAPLVRFLAATPVTVTYDGGAGEYVRTATVSGLNAFLYENAAFLLLVLILINISVLAQFAPGKADR